MKQDNPSTSTPSPSQPAGNEPENVIDIGSSNDDSDSDENLEAMADVESDDRIGGLVPPVLSILPIAAVPCNVVLPASTPSLGTCKQFWKAGDYEGVSGGDREVSAGGFDHVRVHPKFLHSNATSHKWVLGAFAELLDNALDEVHSGATYVKVDVLNNRKDGTRMVLIEDDGGGMNPEKMRHCMSLGYSAKSKLANTIGQYGNGFKTSTMRIGADVIVFSRCCGKDGKSSTQSIGLLSYTFLKCTGKEDIVVPMLDYEQRGSEWCQILRSSVSDWDRNVETIVRWSPFTTEEDLLCQFTLMKDQGTMIFIYNLWEDDEGKLELDFDTDPHDIQLRGVNRDQKNIEMAAQFPNSRHFLTYKHSLRSYASILYLRLPPTFRIILRGRDVEHHNIVNDMMETEKITYRPKEGAEELAKFSILSVVVTIGFVKDAKHHVDVQGFNVYHKNRLIKPFWRIWNAAGSDGRGVIGVLEANFVEPAHDKQGFERTTVLSRLEARLVQMQKTFWRSKCHKIGYAPKQGKKYLKDSEDNESSPPDPKGSGSSRKRTASSSFKSPTSAPKTFELRSNVSQGGKGSVKDYTVSGSVSLEKGGKHGSSSSNPNKRAKPHGGSVIGVIDSDDDNENDSTPERNVSELPETSTGLSKLGSGSLILSQSEKEKASELPKPPSASRTLIQLEQQEKVSEPPMPRSSSLTISQLEQENEELKERLNKKEEVFLLLQEELSREKELRKKLEAEVQTAKEKLEAAEKDQDGLMDLYNKEKERHVKEEEKLRNQLQAKSKKNKR